ncbi:MAG: secretin N-terminal domain-containing protein [Puniceicoccales bacterium]
MKLLNLLLLALMALAVCATTSTSHAQTTAEDDPSVEAYDRDASDLTGTAIPSPYTNPPYAGSTKEGQTPPAEDNTQSATAPATSSATPSTSATSGTTSSEPQSVQAYAPDSSGMTVRQVTQSEPVMEETVDASGATTMSQEAVEIPAMEIDFAGDTGKATVEFPSENRADEALMGADDTISVDFPDEEVRTIIRNVADLYDLNVVIPDTLAGSTSIKLRNVTWRQVLEVVLDPLGYTYVVDRNIIKIKSKEELTNEPTVTRVFLINYAVASTMQNSLAPLIDTAAGGRVQVDKRTNALLVTERPSQMNEIQAIIERLDRPNPQVMIESKFIEINDTDRSDKGINWASLQGYQVSAGPFNRQYAAEHGKENEYGYVVDNDVTNTQTSGQSQGQSFSTGGGFNQNMSQTASNLGNQVFNSAVLGDMTWIDNVTRSDTAVFSAAAFNVVLSFLESNTDAKLVNNPTLVTLDGEEARLVIGEQFPIPSYTFNDETGSFEVSGFEYKDIGTILSVTPNVNSAGFIRLNVRPQLSRSDRTTNFGGAGGAEIPIIQTTETQSNVILKDGFTLAIGGLISDLTNDVDTSVPYLSEIPLLGELFQHSTKQIQRRNLLIFITAKTLNPDGTTYKDIVDPRVLYRMGILENEIPGYQLPEDQAAAYNEIMSLQNRLDNDTAQVELLERVSNLKEGTESAMNGDAAE